MTKKPIAADMFMGVFPKFAKMKTAITLKVAKTKLESGLTNMLAMMIGKENTNRLRPFASSLGVSVKANKIINNIKKDPRVNQLGTYWVRFRK